MATVSEMSREDKRILYDVLAVLRLDDSELRKGIERLAARTRAGMTEEDVAWVEQKLQ
jgi:hypothetical protein